MYQQEALQETKLSEGEITRQHGLHPLLTTDAHTDVSRCTERKRRISIRTECVTLHIVCADLMY